MFFTSLHIIRVYNFTPLYMSFGSKIIYRGRNGSNVVSTVEGAAECIKRFPPIDPTKIVVTASSDKSKVLEDKAPSFSILKSNSTPFLSKNHYSYIIPTFEVGPGNVVSAMWANKTKSLSGLNASGIKSIGVEYSPYNDIPKHKPVKESYLSGAYNVSANEPLILHEAAGQNSRIDSSSLMELDLADIPPVFKTYVQNSDGSYDLKGQRNAGLVTNLDRYFGGKDNYMEMHDKIDSSGYYDGYARAERECSSAIGYYNPNDGTIAPNKMAKADLFSIAMSATPERFNASIDWVDRNTGKPVCFEFSDMFLQV